MQFKVNKKIILEEAIGKNFTIGLGALGVGALGAHYGGEMGYESGSNQEKFNEEAENNFRIGQHKYPLTHAGYPVTGPKVDNLIAERQKLLSIENPTEEDIKKAMNLNSTINRIIYSINSYDIYNRGIKTEHQAYLNELLKHKEEISKPDYNSQRMINAGNSEKNNMQFKGGLIGAGLGAIAGNLGHTMINKNKK